MTAPTDYRIDVWIDAESPLVFEYFTDPKRFIEWQGSAAEFELCPGGLYRVEYGGAAVVSGEFVEIEPPRRLVYLRCLEGVTTRPSRVEIELVPERGGTRVSVHHTDFGPDEGVDRGWPGFLARLQARLAS